jgi:hypothetical protein
VQTDFLTRFSKAAKEINNEEIIDVIQAIVGMACAICQEKECRWLAPPLST